MTNARGDEAYIPRCDVKSLEENTAAINANSEHKHIYICCKFGIKSIYTCTKSYICLTAFKASIADDLFVLNCSDWFDDDSFAELPGDEKKSPCNKSFILAPDRIFRV